MENETQIRTRPAWLYPQDYTSESVSVARMTSESLPEPRPVADYAGTDYACGLHPTYRG